MNNQPIYRHCCFCVNMENWSDCAYPQEGQSCRFCQLQTYDITTVAVEGYETHLPFTIEDLFK